MAHEQVLKSVLGICIPCFLLQLTFATVIRNISEGCQDVIGLQRVSGYFWTSVFRFTVLSKDDDASRLEALSNHVSLEVFLLETLSHGIRALLQFVGIEKGAPAHTGGDLLVSKDAVEIEFLVSIEVEGVVVLVEGSESLVVL